MIQLLIKSKPFLWVLTILNTFIIYIQPIQHIFYGLYFFVLLDVIMGIWASLKKGEDFTSKRLKIGLINKTFTYTIALSVILVIEYLFKDLIGSDGFILFKSLSSLVVVYEGVSIIEKLNIIYPSQIWNKIINMIKKKTNPDED